MRGWIRLTVLMNVKIMGWNGHEASCTYFEISEGILDCLNCDLEERRRKIIENCGSLLHRFCDLAYSI